MEQLKTGISAELEIQVKDSDTAIHFGSGELPVFSTPALVGLMENAAVIALKDHLPAGQTTLGIHIDVRHLSASPVGMRVRAKAELTNIEGRKLSFQIEAWDDVDLIGEALHERMVVDIDRFLSKVDTKKKTNK